MNLANILCLLLVCGVLYAHDDDDVLASKAKADEMEKIRCGYTLIKLWTAEVAHTPFAAAPLIADVDADGKLDIVAAPLSEAQTVITAETGTTLPHSKWPAQKLDSSFLASPLQFDIDNDGMLDILFVTSSGEFIFFSPNGTAVKNKNFQVPPAYVKQRWHTEVISVSGQDVYQYVSVGDENVRKDKSYLPVDSHVLATPVLADVNIDHHMEELVIPVSYYFDDEDYSLPEDYESINNINSTDLNKYVVSGIVVVSLTRLEVISTIFLDLTTAGSQFPAYVLFSPTVVDMDRNGGHMEVVIGTSAGNVHVIETEHGVKDRSGFPRAMGSVHGQVTVADVNKDGTLELIAMDTSGNVVCLNEDGTLTWEAEISGTSSPGSRLVDLDGDGYPEVIITTNEGDVYAIHGVTGKVLDNWPVKTGHPIMSNVVVTHVSSSRKELDLVFLSNDGALHVVSTDRSCRTHFPVGESSLVQILSHDIVSHSEGLELLIATKDGALICMGSGEETFADSTSDDAVYQKALKLSLPAETQSPNDFLFAEKKFGVYVQSISRHQSEVTGGQFYIQFAITDPSYVPTSQKMSRYTLHVYFGSILLHRVVFTNPDAYTITVTSHPRPSRGHVTLVVTNQHGLVAKDSFPIRFNQVILEDLRWLLMAPFSAMVIILLVNHGFPAKDLLPITIQSKTR